MTTMAIATVQSKFAITITSSTTHRRIIHASLRARRCTAMSNYAFLAPTSTNTIPPNKRRSTHERRERDGLLGVGGGMDRTNIDNLFAACVGDALVSKSDDSQHDRAIPTSVIGLMRIKLLPF